jgi:hypothetical protein
VLSEGIPPRNPGPSQLHGKRTQLLWFSPPWQKAGGRMGHGALVSELSNRCSVLVPNSHNIDVVFTLLVYP